jgi:hypothetical protein
MYGKLFLVVDTLLMRASAPSDGNKYPVCFSGFPLASDEL